MKRKLFWAFFIIFLFAVIFTAHVFAEDYHVTIVSNNKIVMFPDAQAYISDTGRVMVPIRFIAESYGIKVDWLGKTEEVLLQKDGLKIRFKAGTNRVSVNGKEQTIDAETTSSGGRTFVPLRFVSEVMGYKVGWINQLRWAIVEDSRSTVDFNGIAGSIVSTLENCKGEADLQKYVRTNNGIQAKEITEYLLNEFMTSQERYFYLEHATTRISLLNDKISNIKLIFKYKYSSEKIKAMREQLKKKTEEILSEIIKPGMTDYEKELAIHDYIVLNTEYDEKVYTADGADMDSYNLYGPLLKGTGVCQGYSQAFKHLLQKAGIKGLIVTGTVGDGSHAWNQAYIGGSWYNTDVTWDDPIPDRPGKVDYGYFNITDRELAQDHIWESGKYNKCTADEYNYYKVNGNVALTRDQLSEMLIEQLADGRDTINIKVMGFMPDMEQMEKIVFGYTNGFSYTPIKENENNIYFVQFSDLRYRC